MTKKKGKETRGLNEDSQFLNMNSSIQQKKKDELRKEEEKQK
jgi:hypothetical protein